MNEQYKKPEYILVERKNLIRLLDLLNSGSVTQISEMLVVHGLEENQLASQNHSPTPLYCLNQDLKYDLFKEKQKLDFESRGKEWHEAIISITTNGNFRLSIDGKVDPLLAGVESLYEIVAKTKKKYFGKGVLSFDCISYSNLRQMPLLSISIEHLLAFTQGEVDLMVERECFTFILNKQEYSEEDKNKLLNSLYFNNILADQIPYDILAKFLLYGKEAFDQDILETLITLRPVESFDYE